MMKKLMIITLAVFFMVSLSSCKNKDEVSHSGVNAQIVELTQGVDGMVVKSLDEESILGDHCYINCEDADTYFIYADYVSGETTDLAFEDFMVGDEIVLGIKMVKDKATVPVSVQLSTQRL